MMSSTCSRPIESRTRSSVTPLAACSSSLSCWWVVVAGWMISDFASPTLASRLKSWTLLIRRLAGLAAAANAECQHAAEAAVQVARRVRVGRVGLQARVADPRDARVLLQPARHRQRVGGVALDPQRERLEALQEQEAVEGAQGGAQVAQSLHAELDDEGEVADRFDVADAVIGGIRLHEVGEAPRCPPVERAAVHHDPADRRAVPADPLRGRVDDDVRAVPDRPAEERSERVVDDQRDPVGMGHVGDRGDVGHVQARVADRLDVDRLRVVASMAGAKLAGSEPSTKRVVMPSLGSVQANRL